MQNPPESHKDISSKLEGIEGLSLNTSESAGQVHLEHKYGGIKDIPDPIHLLGIQKFGKPMQDSFQFADDLSRIFAINLSIKLNIFEAINELGDSFKAQDLIKKLNFKTSTRHLLDLLDQLFVFGLLERDGVLENANYRITDYVRNYLLKTSPNNYIYVFLNLDRYIKKYEKIQLSFPTGKTQFIDDDITANEEDLKCYMEYYCKSNEFNFDNLINEINFEKYKTVIDIHGLNACLAMKIKTKYPKCNLISFDNKYLKEKAETKLKGHEMFEMVKLEFGDLRKDKIPEADCVLAPHILMHLNYENKKNVLKGIFESLRMNGDLIIMENLVDENRSKDSCGLKISFMFAIMGYEGYASSFNEYKELLIDAGFEDVKILSRQYGLSDLIIARKLKDKSQ